MLDWIFEGIITWVSSIVSDMMDAVSGLFLQALGTDMTAMEEYFPFVTKAFTVMQYTAWAILFLITIWQLFRIFGGPITEAENPWTLIARSALFALLIWYAKPIFSMTLDIATAPYTALMDIQMTAEDFTFAGVEQALKNGLTTLIASISVVGLLLLVILEIALLLCSLEYQIQHKKQPGLQPFDPGGVHGKQADRGKHRDTEHPRQGGLYLR